MAPKAFPGQGAERVWDVGHISWFLPIAIVGLFLTIYENYVNLSFLKCFTAGPEAPANDIHRIGSHIDLLISWPCGWVTSSIKMASG